MGGEAQLHNDCEGSSPLAVQSKDTAPLIKEHAQTDEPIIQASCLERDDNHPTGHSGPDEVDSGAISKSLSPDILPPEPELSSQVQGPLTQGVGDTKAETSTPKEVVKRPDILWCLSTVEKDKASRSFYKDQAWEGINNGLPGSADDKHDEEKAIMVYYVQADVRNKTNKEGNTSSTWRDEPADFEFGRDAIMLSRYWPHIKLYSKKLIRIMELLLDYYPAHLGDFDEYQSMDDTFYEFMYYYQELKAYLGTYVDSLPKDGPTDSRLEIGSCGDEEYAEFSLKYLDFGALDMEKEPCDEAKALEIAVLLRLLASMYRVKVAPTMTARFNHNEPLIKYDTMWLLMRPGTLVYVQQSAFRNDMDNRYIPRENWQKFLPTDKERSAWIVASWSYENKDTQAPDQHYNIDRFELELWSIQYDGTSFQRVSRQASIPRFEGFNAIKTLQVIPSDVQDKLDGGELRKRLENRGHKYLSILKETAAHREYDDPRSGYRGQIIVDPEAYMQHAYSTSEGFRRPDPIADGGGGQKFRAIVDFTPFNSETFPRIAEVRILLPRWIEGFGLKTKKWMVFEIDAISETAPVPSVNQLNSELILVSDNDKEVLRTILPKGKRPLGITSDFINGKGEGKIFLLYGPPGTGKTLTVECVANDTNRPLLSLTAQDVGTRTNFDAEAELRQWFTLAAKWDAILLIDEADLFLEQRREGGLEQNNLSSIFLRTMEYYKGILFLTTNRAGHIDDSFISRITVPIAYHSLSSETKAKIIKRFIRKFEETGTVEIEQRGEKHIITHCEDLNGRQIRNVLQNAVALAEVQRHDESHETAQSAHSGGGSDVAEVVKVKWHHVKAAVERQMEFRSYLDSLKGRDESARARAKQDYLPTPPRVREDRDRW